MAGYMLLSVREPLISDGYLIQIFKSELFPRLETKRWIYHKNITSPIIPNMYMYMYNIEGLQSNSEFNDTFI